MSFTLPELPFPKDSLGPHMSAETLDYHYGKHHQAYVNKLNELTQGTPLAEKSLPEIVVEAKGGVFNNAAQVWNHTFFWNSLSPSGGGEPSGAVAEALSGTFGDVQTFREQFTKAAATHFGSGWAWLLKTTDGKLVVESTANAGCPLTEGKTPLLTCDVWEHAYYVDYRNARPTYLQHFWQLVNWDFVAKNLQEA